MTWHEADVAVLGAGPAGCVAARQLGKAGLDVILVDAGAGMAGHQIESFPASGAPLAEDIGLLSILCAVSDGPAAVMRMTWRDTPERRVFEGDGPLLLQRAELHRALREEAARHVCVLPSRVRKVSDSGHGAQVVTDAGTIRCRMAIDARGRHALKRPASDLVALPFRLRGDVPDHTMWLDALPCGWLWAASLTGDRVHGTLFQQSAALAGSTARTRLGHAHDQLAGQVDFRGMTQLSVGSPVAAGLSVVTDPVLSARHVLIGDAALARDPIASHGLVHAMRSGVQAAIAVGTILDPAVDSEAAYAFLRHKHAEAATTAKQATAQAYREQSRFAGSIWAGFGASTESRAAPQVGNGPLTLAVPLSRAPVLDPHRVRWAPAIELPLVQDFFTRQGGVTALDIAAACRPAATMQEIAARLGRVHPDRLVREVLQHLVTCGAFVQAVPAPSRSARARLTSQPSSSETIRDSAC